MRKKHSKVEEFDLGSYILSIGGDGYLTFKGYCKLAEHIGIKITNRIVEVDDEVYIIKDEYNRVRKSLEKTSKKWLEKDETFRSSLIYMKSIKAILMKIDKFKKALSDLNLK